MFATQIASAIDDARSLSCLNDISSAIWKGLAAGALGDEDAQRFAELIYARKTAIKASTEPLGRHSSPESRFPPRRPQRPPIRSVALERRRRLASSGPLPPSWAYHFSCGELAVLRIIGDECRAKGTCALPLAAIAARAGVCRKLVQNTIRRAKRLGVVDVEERRRPGRPSLTNVVKIASAEWRAWLARGPRSDRGGGKKVDPTDTRISFRENTKPNGAAKNRQHRASGRRERKSM